MPARLLFVGMDAAEATLIERWAAAGELPTLARLAATRAPLRLGNSLETLPGAIWPEFTTGRSGGKDGLFYHPRQLPAGEARFRAIRAEDADGRTFFSVASDAGRRVAVVDLPQTVPVPGRPCLHVREWGLHDRTFNIASDPPELIAELRGRHGDHPIVSCDTHGETREGYETLLRGLKEGARKKTELLLDVLAREPWDLFACAFGETHCVGHHFWHFFDEGAARHPPDTPAHFRDAIRDVYRAVDEGLGRLIAAAGPEAEVVVVASHGMGPYTGGPHLLPEVLARLGMGGKLRTRLRANLPQPVVAALRRLVPVELRRRAHAAADGRAHPFESGDTRAICVENNRCGGLRLNLRGRDPHGRVAPGAEAAALIEELRAELLALQTPAGARIVARVVTAEEAFGPHAHPHVPDLMVVFRTDLGPLETCRSPRVGVVRAPIHKPHLPRTGDHTVESRLWAAGGRLPGVITADASRAHVLDVAPTLLALLDVPRPAWLDGRSLLGAG